MGNQAEDSTEVSPSMGSSRLLGQYQIIAQRLKSFESSISYYSPRPTEQAKRAFSQGLSFIHTEVLVSYREDLLDTELSLTTLFIDEEEFHWKIPLLTFVGVAVAIILGVSVATYGATFMTSLFYVVLFSSPFLFLWHYFPRNSAMKRIRYARWLSDEVERRNGPPGKRRFVERLESIQPAKLFAQPEAVHGRYSHNKIVFH